MKKKVTLTKRWQRWAQGYEGHPAEPFWAYTALSTMMLSFLSLGVHLCFFLSGSITGGALVSMIIFAVLTEAIFIYRVQGWWAWYWGLCVILGVGIFELLSFFIGKPL